MRKFVSMVVHHGALIALADDGTLWEIKFGELSPRTVKVSEYVYLGKTPEK